MANFEVDPKKSAKAAVVELAADTVAKNTTQDAGVSGVAAIAAGNTSDIADIQAGTSLTGERDDPETALANLIAILETAGILTDNTTAT